VGETPSSHGERARPDPSWTPRRGPRPLTVLVEPDPGGHRFQWVSHVVRGLAREGSDVLLLTSVGAPDTDAYRTFLGPLDVPTVERFAEIYPRPAEVGEAILEAHLQRPISRWVVMDSDQLVKRWWLHAPPELRGRRAPYGVLVMTRFPPSIQLDRRLLWLRGGKSLGTVLAMARGAARRMAYVAGRDQLRQGLLFKRLRDPALCSAHASDRAELRERQGLPQDRRLVGVLGLVDERKCVPLVGAATFAAGPDVDLLLAGGVSADVDAWLQSLPPELRERVHLRAGFLSDADLDECTAACDIVSVVQIAPGPSGIMGKAQVAGVPVLSAGSRVRRRETEVLGSGVHTEMTVESIAGGIRELLARGSDPVPVPPSLPTAEEFADVLLTGGAKPLRKIAVGRPPLRTGGLLST
jgi:hypothetical protein